MNQSPEFWRCIGDWNWIIKRSSNELEPEVLQRNKCRRIAERSCWICFNNVESDKAGKHRPLTRFSLHLKGPAFDRCPSFAPGPRALAPWPPPPGTSCLQPHRRAGITRYEFHFMLWWYPFDGLLLGRAFAIEFLSHFQAIRAVCAGCVL